MDSSNTFEKMVALLKRRGFVYPSSDLYGGLSGFWDFGPLGVELKNNVKAAWWGSMVRAREDVVGLDSAIIYNRRVWEASGHTENFADPLIECKKCHSRYRADTLKGEKCPNCRAADFTAPKMFNLMFKTYVGPVESEDGLAYLRPETAQGIFINFQNVLNTTRLKVPFGIAQIGKAFRNEITTGNFIFRSREFEQAELEWFCEPKEADKWFKYWQKERISWFEKLGMAKKNLKFREHEVTERAHYAVTAFDIEYQFPWGWGELEGIANRSDYDLKAHNLSYKDEETGREYVPFVVEPSVGIERSAFAFLLDSYAEDGSGDKKRVILKLHPKLSPYKVAVFPLLANKPDLVKKAREIFKTLTVNGLMVAWDARGNIGKRYFSQDEIGTPWCVTVDFTSLEDGSVTVRERDSAKQKRVKIEELPSYFLKELSR